MNEHYYIVLYDLCQPGINYSQLYMALQSFSNWRKLTESTWAIVSERDTVQVRDYLS